MIARMAIHDGPYQLLKFDITAAPEGTVNIHDVEIFKAGKWNGDEYTIADLDELVTNFALVGYKPPVKLGHTEDPSALAYGWVEGLSRQGDRLIAQLSSVPKPVAETIRLRQLDTVSVEVFYNLDRDGTKYRRALAAVALLGAHPPAVSDLKPLHRSLSILRQDFEGVRAYTVNIKETKTMADKDPAASAADVAKLQADLAAATALVTKLSTTVEKLSTDAIKVTELNQTIETLKKENAEARTARDAEAINRKVDGLLIPAYREQFRALYSLLGGETRLVKFSVAGEVKDISATAVLDSLFEAVNNNAKKLFDTASYGDAHVREQLGGDESVQSEVERLINDRLQKDSKLTYDQAFSSVIASLSADQKRRYAAGQ